MHKYPQLQIGDGIQIPELMSDVEVLQRWLKAWGVLPADSKVDGRFGPFTKAAVERFQTLRPPGPNSIYVPEGLDVTGIVNQNTWAELLKVPPGEVEILPRPEVAAIPNVPGFDIDRIVQKAVLASLRDVAQRTVPLILAECAANQISDRGQIAYILATAEHESHLGNLMTEIGDESYFTRSYDPPSQVARALGNTELGDGPKYRGRGFVQITGRRNYTDWGQRLNIDLVNRPELAVQPATAAKILVIGSIKGTFTGFALGEFVAGKSQDFVNARRVINGTDRADDIANIARFYYEALV
ncbi:peptidoglycan-binding protein [Oscillatoria sp. CS-180]|uniref:peptidoglycan-binding protein n=1 Tax=Oscillatoria sp. CS-180 TaxID=3021720 RepID=UPI00232BC4C4|nr:peptidoglycan-binding protein [Oscillatoria sp. CS-180]MDB9525079.1 peptidoglycan-binding protein [Oscillatoria sp. CS-180]